MSNSGETDIITSRDQKLEFDEYSKKILKPTKMESFKDIILF